MAKILSALVGITLAVVCLVAWTHRQNSTIRSVRVLDQWTGGKHIIFFYSRPLASPPMLFRVVSVDDAGWATELEPSEDWHEIFVKVLAQSDQPKKASENTRTPLQLVFSKPQSA